MIVAIKDEHNIKDLSIIFYYILWRQFCYIKNFVGFNQEKFSFLASNTKENYQYKKLLNNFKFNQLFLIIDIVGFIQLSELTQYSVIYRLPNISYIAIKHRLFLKETYKWLETFQIFKDYFLVYIYIYIYIYLAEILQYLLFFSFEALFFFSVLVQLKGENSSPWKVIFLKIKFRLSLLISHDLYQWTLCNIVSK